MTKPTYQDASLVVRLAQWHTSCDLPAALSWLWSDGFLPDYAAFTQQHPAGSEGDRKATLICEYFETVGVLHKHGLVNEELLFDWLEVAPVWDRIKGYVLGRRGRTGGKPLWANFEALAVAHKRETHEYSTW